MDRAVLVDVSKKVSLQEIVLSSDKFLIGRGLHNSCIIEDISISRTHCIFEQHNGEWSVLDKSSNGTWLNGKILDKTKSYKLTNGDVVGLSETIKFIYKTPAESKDEGAGEPGYKAFSDDEMLDIAETVIAEAEALDAGFCLDKFDGEKKDNLINKNVQNALNGSTSKVNTLQTYGTINIHQPTVLNIIQQPLGPNSLQQPLQAENLPVGSFIVQQPSTSQAVQSISSSSTVTDPTQIAGQTTNHSAHTEKNSIDYVEDELQCSICTEMFVKAVTLSCAHTFCKFCITQWQKNQTVCPICRAKITMQFPTLVVDNFIEKVLENASEDIKQHRRELLAEREAATASILSATAAASMVATTSAASSSTGNRRRRPANEPIEVSSDSEDSSNSNDDDDDNMSAYSGSDWERDYDFDDWYENYNGLPGCYYGGYGQCYSCGERGHWANGCPNRRRR